MVNNASPKRTILDALVEFYETVIHPDFEKMNNRFDGVDQRLDGVDQRLDRLESGQSDLARQLNDLKVDAPTQQEFNDVKGRVRRLEILAHAD